MCGVFGYIGERDALEVCLTGLEQLEYRGYDSTGIAGISNAKIAFCKRAGKLSFLKQKLDLPTLELAIAHTRWATHGKVNDLNAHPHLDAAGSLALIHNGIIENYAQLREQLEREGISFSSETDTEVVVNLIAKHYRGNLLEAVHKTLPLLRGMFAFLFIHKAHPDEIVAAARGCPLSVGINDQKTESIVSSDPNAFQGAIFDIFFLGSDEMASVRKGKVELFNSSLKPVARKGERLATEARPPSKEGFEHFMLKEIFEQSAAVQKAFLGRLEPEIFFEELKLSPSFLRAIRQLKILACGTSAHAGSIASFFFEDFAHLSAQTEIASEARHRNLFLSKRTLAIAISQSGETADTLAALREVKKQGSKVLGICNVKNSALTREADGILFLKAGPEMSVCSTKAFTSQLTSLFLFALYLGRLQGTLSQEQSLSYIEELKKIPGQIQQLLERSYEVERLAKKYASYENFFFMGRHYMFPTCLEAALKLKEISYVNANGYPAGELKHGPIALLHARFPVVAFCANKKTQEKMNSNLTEVKARGAPLLAIAPEDLDFAKAVADDCFFLPKTIDPLAPFLSAIVGQLFAYFVAKERGCEIDQPRHLAKSVTVE